MPAIVSSLIASLGLVLAAPVLFVIVFVFANRASGMRDEDASLIATALTFAMFVVVWLRIWSPLVRWSHRRTYATLVAFFASTAIGLGAYVSYYSVVSFGRRGYGDSGQGVVLGAMALWAAWVFGTALAWRETPNERRLRLQAGSTGKLPCPQCGYDLTGLHEARCPECGTQYTLNELLADALDRRADLPE